MSGAEQDTPPDTRILGEFVERKFHALVDPVLGHERASVLIERCTALADIKDLRALASLARPAPQAGGA